jgi:hypothetical protein
VCVCVAAAGYQKHLKSFNWSVSVVKVRQGCVRHNTGVLLLLHDFQKAPEHRNMCELSLLGTVVTTSCPLVREMACLHGSSCHNCFGNISVQLSRHLQQLHPYNPYKAMVCLYHGLKQLVPSGPTAYNKVKADQRCFMHKRPCTLQ